MEGVMVRVEVVVPRIIAKPMHLSFAVKEWIIPIIAPIELLLI